MQLLTLFRLSICRCPHRFLEQNETMNKRAARCISAVSVSCQDGVRYVCQLVFEISLDKVSALAASTMLAMQVDTLQVVGTGSTSTHSDSTCASTL